MLSEIYRKVLVAIGVARFLRWRNRNKLLIVYLHSVINEDEPMWEPLRAHMPVRIFRQQLEIISRYYEWISLDTAIDMLAGRRPMRRNCIVMTFDDGYRNNMTDALPALEKHGAVPAFYIASGMLNNSRPYWFERFDYVIQHLREAADVRLGPHAFHFVPGDRDGLREQYARLRETAKAHFESDREFYEFFDEVSRRLESSCGHALADIQATDPCSATLSDAEIKELMSSGRATIGSHTVDHFRLDVVDEETCRDQLQRSKATIESLTGQSCDHFCYPNGNMNGDVAQLVREAGYKSAVTTNSGLNAAGDDPYALRRMHLPGKADEDALLLQLCGFGDIMTRLRSIFGGARD